MRLPFSEYAPRILALAGMLLLFANSTHAQTSGFPPTIDELAAHIRVASGAIPSKAFPSDRARGQRATNRADADRLSAEELLNNIIAVEPGRNIANAVSTASNLLDIRDWLIKSPAYGNLVLAYAAQEKATRLLFASLAENPSANFIGPLSDRVARGQPRYGHWSAMLVEEGEGEKLLPKAGQFDDEALVMLIIAISSVQGGIDETAPFLKRSLSECWRQRNIGQLGWHAGAAAVQLLALEVCLKMNGAMPLPLDRSGFISSARNQARELLDQPVRGGIRIDAFSVWGHWEQAQRDRGARAQTVRSTVVVDAARVSTPKQSTKPESVKTSELPKPVSYGGVIAWGGGLILLAIVVRSLLRRR